MNDVVIYEAGSGGDLELLGNDLSSTSGLFNMVYMAWFGGNPEASTTGNEIDSELRDDWFGNALLFNNENQVQFNSTLEKTLNNTALDSSGRITIEEAAKKDLNFINEIADFNVFVSILSDSKVSIIVELKEPENIQEKQFQIIWDNLKNEVITKKTI
tara:strand:+ start:5246 stop:5719 length:474 start_codon:yes stop_codon:yes gene_type:complete